MHTTALAADAELLLKEERGYVKLVNIISSLKFDNERRLSCNQAIYTLAYMLEI